MSDNFEKTDDPKVEPANQDHGSTEWQEPQTNLPQPAELADEEAAEQAPVAHQDEDPQPEVEEEEGKAHEPEPAEEKASEPEDDRTFEQKTDDRLAEIERHLGINRTDAE